MAFCEISRRTSIVVGTFNALIRVVVYLPPALRTRSRPTRISVGMIFPKFSSCCLADKIAENWLACEGVCCSE
jgi:hypothetical protein